MKYLLRDCDFVLIREAVALGDKLKNLLEATAANVGSIGQLQAVLRKLPECSRGAHGDFGFGQYSLDRDFEGAIRSWWVAINGRGTSGLIEISSACSFIPFDPDKDLWRQMDEEDEFNFVPDREVQYDAHDYQRWILQVQDPESWRKPNLEFEVTANFEILPHNQKAP